MKKDKILTMMAMGGFNGNMTEGFAGEDGQKNQGMNNMLPFILMGDDDDKGMDKSVLMMLAMFQNGGMGNNMLPFLMMGKDSPFKDKKTLMIIMNVAKNSPNAVLPLMLLQDEATEIEEVIGLLVLMGVYIDSNIIQALTLMKSADEENIKNMISEITEKNNDEIKNTITEHNKGLEDKIDKVYDAFSNK